jgi:hypothetical protein
MSKLAGRKRPEGRGFPEIRTLVYLAAPLVFFAAAGIYGHIKVSSDSSHTMGIPLVLNHLFNVLIACGMFALFFAVGRRILGLFGFEWNSFAEESAFCIAVGAGVMALLILAAALAGILNLYAVGIVFLVGLVVCGSQLVPLINVARTAISRDYSRPSEIAYILSFAAVVLVMVLRALTPPHAVDEAIYHLAVVKRFVEAGSLTPLYDIAQGNTHMLAHMLYAPCLMLGADSAAKLLSVGFALVTALSLYAYARRFLDQATGYVAALGFFGAGMVVEVAITARIDVILAGFLFFATYSLTVYLENRKTRWLWLSAFLSGVAVSIKLTGLIWVAILGCVYLLQTLPKSSKREVLLHLQRGTLYFFILLAVVSPWLLKNYVYFRDPFYPFAHGETVTDQRTQPITYFGDSEEAKLDSYFQSARERNPQVAQRIGEILGTVAARRPERHPFRFWGYFTNPNVYNVGEPDHTPNYLFVLCPLFLIFTRNRKLVWLGISCVVFFVLMAWAAWTARYLLPLYPPLTLIAAYTVVRASELLKRKTGAPVALALPLIALLLTTGYTVFSQSSRLIKMLELNYVNGSLSRADYLSLVFYYPALRYVNENITPDAKVLMIGSQMGYDLQRPYVGDTTWEATPWRRLLLKGGTPEGVRDAMKAQGITHVVYGPELYTFATATGSLSIAAHKSEGPARPDYYEQLRNWTTFEDFKSKYLEQVYKDPNSRYGVYVLR